MKRAIDILHDSDGDSDDVEKAVRMHMDCPACRGGGGNHLYPESPCAYCGFTFADSFGVENIVAIIEEIEKARSQYEG